MKQILLRLTFLLLLLVIALPLQADDTSAALRVNSLQVYSGPLDSVAFSPDGRLLASGGRDNTVRLWDVLTGDMVLSSVAHEDWITSLAFSPNGQILATGSRDNSIRLLDVYSGALLRVVGHHRGDVTDLEFTPDGEILASAARDGFIELHNIETGEKLAVIENYGGPVWDIEFSPNGSVLASASEDGVIWLWGLWGAEGAWLKQLKGHNGPVTRLAYSQDGARLLSGGLDGTLRLWDLSGPETAPARESIAVMRGHLAPIMGVGFTANAEIGISVSLDGSIRMWDTSGSIELGRELSVINGSGAPLTHLALDPLHITAASAGTDGILNLWNLGPDTVSAIISSSDPISIVRTRPPGGNVTTLIDPQPSSPIQPTSNPDSPRSVGQRGIRIPTVGIESPVTTFYLDGVSWAIDPWDATVGHFQGTAWLDRIGNLVLGGHSEYPNGSPGIFNALYDVGIGDEIFVWDAERERRYVVVNIMNVDYRDLSVVYPTERNRLTLITCDIPSYVAESNIYYERLVVVAEEIR